MIYEKVVEILAEQFDIDSSEITSDTLIVDDLGADSLDVVDIMMSLEDEFTVEVPDEAVDGIKTVGDIVKFVEDNR